MPALYQWRSQSQARPLPFATAISKRASPAQMILHWCASTNHDLVGLNGDAAALWGRSEAPSRHCARSLSMILVGGAPRTMCYHYLPTIVHHWRPRRSYFALTIQKSSHFAGSHGLWQDLPADYCDRGSCSRGLCPLRGMQ